MRSKHPWPTLQLTVRSKLKPVSITDKKKKTQQTHGSLWLRLFTSFDSHASYSLFHFLSSDKLLIALALLLAVPGPKDVL